MSVVGSDTTNDGEGASVRVNFLNLSASSSMPWLISLSFGLGASVIKLMFHFKNPLTVTLGEGLKVISLFLCGLTYTIHICAYLYAYATYDYVIYSRGMFFTFYCLGNGYRLLFAIVNGSYDMDCRLCKPQLSYTSPSFMLGFGRCIYKSAIAQTDVF